MLSPAVVAADSERMVLFTVEDAVHLQTPLPPYHSPSSSEKANQNRMKKGREMKGEGVLKEGLLMSGFVEQDSQEHLLKFRLSHN